jgi:hypothetical protein
MRKKCGTPDVTLKAANTPDRVLAMLFQYGSFDFRFAILDLTMTIVLSTTVTRLCHV